MRSGRALAPCSIAAVLLLAGAALSSASEPALPSSSPRVRVNEALREARQKLRDERTAGRMDRLDRLTSRERLLQEMRNSTGKVTAPLLSLDLEPFFLGLFGDGYLLKGSLSDPGERLGFRKELSLADVTVFSGARLEAFAGEPWIFGLEGAWFGNAGRRIADQSLLYRSTVFEPGWTIRTRISGLLSGGFAGLALSETRSHKLTALAGVAYLLQHSTITGAGGLRAAESLDAFFPFLEARLVLPLGGGAQAEFDVRGGGLVFDNPGHSQNNLLLRARASLSTAVWTWLDMKISAGYLRLDAARTVRGVREESGFGGFTFEVSLEARF